jgi:hypothetical protein
MCMLRNQVATLLLSLGIEFMQHTVGFVYPSFAECWWEKIFIDLLGTNLIGNLLGAAVIRYFNMKRYHWFIEPTPHFESLSNLEKFKYFFSHRLVSIKEGKWHVFSSVRNFLLIIWLYCCVWIFDIVNYILKYGLQLPFWHWVRSVRVVVFGLNGVLFGADFYRYITKRKGYSMGLNIF